MSGELHRGLETYVTGVRLGVNSPSNFTPGPYMIGAVVPRCFDPSWRVRTLGLYEGLTRETVDHTLLTFQAINNDCNGEEALAGRLDCGLLSETMVGVLGERIQHQHVLSLLDSLVETLLDTQTASVTGTIRVIRGLVVSHRSEVFQNTPGFVRKLHDKMGLMVIEESCDLVGEVADIIVQPPQHQGRRVQPHQHGGRQGGPADLAESGRGTSATRGDMLLEIIREQDSNISATSAQVVGTASALTVMLDTRKLEALARVELGRLVGALVRMISRSLSQTVCWQAGLESLRCVFSSVGSVVVAGSLVTSVMADYTNLVSLLERIMEAVTQHAPTCWPSSSPAYWGRQARRARTV